VPRWRADPIVYEQHPGDAGVPLPATYRRREPEHTVLYRVVQDHLQTFLAQARGHNPNGYGMPSFMEREFTRYLECGVLAGNGFVRVHCDDCGHDRWSRLAARTERSARPAARVACTIFQPTWSIVCFRKIFPFANGCWRYQNGQGSSSRINRSSLRRCSRFFCARSSPGCGAAPDGAAFATAAPAL
jgi:hypothetical protein